MGQLIGDYNTVSFKPVEDNLFGVENIEKEKTIELKKILLMEYWEPFIWLIIIYKIILEP